MSHSAPEFSRKCKYRGCSVKNSISGPFSVKPEVIEKWEICQNPSLHIGFTCTESHSNNIEFINCVIDSLTLSIWPTWLEMALVYEINKCGYWRQFSQIKLWLMEVSYGSICNSAKWEITIQSSNIKTQHQLGNCYMLCFHNMCNVLYDFSYVFKGCKSFLIHY